MAPGRAASGAARGRLRRRAPPPHRSRAVLRLHLRSLAARPDAEALTHLAGLAAAGELLPVIEETFALEAAPEAMRLLETRHARGKFRAPPLSVRRSYDPLTGLPQACDEALESAENDLAGGTGKSGRPCRARR
ncbi:zinc-binding dehydrogenase [Spongiactinospora sp. 9N601]|uniref:zinc-binding dehydrogenase n=1 Tax=Spongiactinospora sp. 9N601 TaxID=3375149 RepID=UPI0037BA7B3A